VSSPCRIWHLCWNLTNIIVALEPGGAVTAKIIDLGLAKGASEFGSESEISSPGAFAGTPAFASPEQFAGLGADIRSDLYSLGVTLWEMLAGQIPFRGSPSELMHEHQQASLPTAEGSAAAGCGSAGSDASEGS
jgi:serine/threonine protein kinase